MSSAKETDQRKRKVARCVRLVNRLEVKEIVPHSWEAEALLALSAAWEAEGSCYGYRRNSPSDLEGRRMFAALEKGEVAGYLLGRVECSQQMHSLMPEGTPCFELEELYVKPDCRSVGVGAMLFRYAEERVEADYILLSAVSKNYRALLHFYIDEIGMELWSARLFKPLRAKKEIGEGI